MKIQRLKKKRNIIYQQDPESEIPGTPVLESETYEVFKLRIQRRETGDEFGEVNFVVREKTNNLRYLLLYCRMDEPGEICSMSFWINSRVTLPPGETVYAGDLLDPEKASLFVMDFTETHLKKKYSFPGGDLQQP